MCRRWMYPISGFGILFRGFFTLAFRVIRLCAVGGIQLVGRKEIVFVGVCVDESFLGVSIRKGDLEFF